MIQKQNDSLNVRVYSVLYISIKQCLSHMICNDAVSTIIEMYLTHTLFSELMWLSSIITNICSYLITWQILRTTGYNPD